jgi:hypothetical protein
MIVIMGAMAQMTVTSESEFYEEPQEEENVMLNTEEPKIEKEKTKPKKKKRGEK